MCCRSNCFAKLFGLQHITTLWLGKHYYTKWFGLQHIITLWLGKRYYAKRFGLQHIITLWLGKRYYAKRFGLQHIITFGLGKCEYTENNVKLSLLYTFLSSTSSLSGNEAVCWHILIEMKPAASDWSRISQNCDMLN